MVFSIKTDQKPNKIFNTQRFSKNEFSLRQRKVAPKKMTPYNKISNERTVKILPLVNYSVYWHLIHTITLNLLLDRRTFRIIPTSFTND